MVKKNKNQIILNDICLNLLEKVKVDFESNYGNQLEINYDTIIASLCSNYLLQNTSVQGDSFGEQIKNILE